MSQIFFSKFQNNSQACLKVVNEKGEELSLAGDDSCGAMKILGRLSYCIFPHQSSSHIQDELPISSGEDLLKALAKHLGYDVFKKDDPENNPSTILDGIAEVLESRGYVHMCNAEGIAHIIDEAEKKSN